MTLRQPLRRAALLLATGLILVIFSERMFWSVWRPDDAIAAYAGAWLLYAVLGYVLLSICWLFQVRGGAGLFLAGACFGWLDEGVVAMTLFGDPSMPFPLTIAWTGLGWHAGLTVAGGFYALRRCLQAGSPWPAAAMAAAIGSFWGVWSLGWLAETPPVGATPLSFLAQTSLATLLLAAAELVLAPAGLAAFRPSRAGLAVAAALVAGFLGLVTIPAVPYAPLILGPLFGLLGLALWRGQGGTGPTVLTVLGAPIRPRNLAGLAALPVAALISAQALGGLATTIPIHLLLALVATAAGFAGLAVAWTRVMRTAPARMARVR